MIISLQKNKYPLYRLYLMISELYQGVANRVCFQNQLLMIITNTRVTVRASCLLYIDATK